MKILDKIINHIYKIRLENCNKGYSPDIDDLGPTPPASLLSYENNPNYHLIIHWMPLPDPPTSYDNM